MKKAIKKSTTTLVNFILDKSGSMSTAKAATISGFNEYVGNLKKDKKNKYEFSLTLFDTVVNKVYVAKDIKDVDELNDKSYSPDGMTALYDAVCQTVEEVKKNLKKGTKVLTVIMTDGEENSSKEYTQVQLKKMIEECQNAGNWSFVFLGANQDSWANAQKFGMHQNNVVNTNQSAAGVRVAFAAMAKNTMNFAGSDDIQLDSFFSNKDKDILENTK